MSIDRMFLRGQRRMLVTTIIGYTLFYFLRKNLSLAMPGLAQDYGITKTSLGLFLTLHGVVYGLGKFVCGPLSDRSRPRRFLMGGLLMALVANVVFGFGPVFASLCAGGADGAAFTTALVTILGIAWVANGFFQSMGNPPCLKLLSHWVPPDELAKILECLEEEPIKWRTITHLLIITGCRRGEIMGLHWDAIDWKGQQLRIDRALLYTAESGVYEDTTKTGETRFIKIPAETMQLLKEYRAYHHGLRLKNGDRWIETDYVFTRDDGGVMNPDNVTQWLSNFAKKYDLPPIHPHKFRHTMASLLIYNGTDTLTVSKRLGHAKVSTTTDIYSHAIKQADERAAESIADVILRRA